MNTSDYWKQHLTGNLPGERAHKLFSPPQRLVPDDKTLKELNPKEAAVLILLFDQGKAFPQTLFMERVAYNGVHSKQISFPGGKREEEDLDFAQTAIRECIEEVNAHKESIELLGNLSTLYIPPSNFIVHPYVAWYHAPPVFKGNPREVKRLFSVGLDELIDVKNQHMQTIDVRNEIIQCPAFNVHSNVIWGATAMILCELLYLTGEFTTQIEGKD